MCSVFFVSEESNRLKLNNDCLCIKKGVTVGEWKNRSIKIKDRIESDVTYLKMLLMLILLIVANLHAFCSAFECIEDFK